MRRVMLLSLALLMVAGCAASAGVTGKSTTDPNPKYGKPADNAADVGSNDKNDSVNRKVTYQAKKKTVSAILAELSEASGVALKAGINGQDWQVRDRKMNLFARDVPLASLMNSMARVMKFKWAKEEKDGKVAYRLYMDRKTLLDAEAQRLREQEKFAQEQADRRAAMFETYTRLEKASEQDLARLKNDNPYLYLAHTSGLQEAMGNFFSQVPGAFEALSSGQNFTISAASLSPSAQQAVLAAAKGISGLEAKFSGGKRQPRTDLDDRLPQMTIELNRMTEHAQSNPMGKFMLGDLSINAGDFHTGLPFFDPNSDIAKLFGKLALRAEEEGKPIDEVMRESMGEFMAAMKSIIKKDDSGDPEVEHADDPDLDRKVKLKLDGSQALEELQSAFAEATGYAVVSDSFGSLEMTRQSFPSPDGGTPIKELLANIAEAFHYNWDKKGATVEFRDRNWFKKRAAQIPEAWLENWRELLKKNGTLDIGELAQIAALSQEQLSTNLMGDPMLREAGMQAMMNRDMLKAYSSLTDAQHAALFTEGGIDLRSLGPDQYQAISKLIMRRDGSILQAEDAVFTLSAKREQDGKRYNYVLTLRSSADGTAPVAWAFATPQYVAPPEPPKEEKKEPAKPADSTR